MSRFLEKVNFRARLHCWLLGCIWRLEPDAPPSDEMHWVCSRCRRLDGT